jgi:hypothetical protein
MLKDARDSAVEQPSSLLFCTRHVAKMTVSAILSTSLSSSYTRDSLSRFLFKVLQTLAPGKTQEYASLEVRPMPIRKSCARDL